MKLVFFAEKEDGQKTAYGPYGTGINYTHNNCSMFAVNGKITSIFGRVVTSDITGLIGLGAIEFYFEDESRGRQET